jgi:predicted regulator of Ras-like GTPase activity (Roadblock/LC7/MglB family)
MPQASFEISRMLAEMARRTPGVEQAVILSSDGLLLSRSEGIDRDSADRFAAVAAGLLGLAVGASGPLQGGPVEEVVVQMRDKMLLVMRINAEGVLATLGTPDCDVAGVAYEMAVLARTAAPLLDAAARSELQSVLGQ